jgi:hypothetical protein
LIKLLKCNKLFEGFERKLALQDSQFRNQFLSSYPELNETLLSRKDNEINDLSELVRISKKLSEHDINLLLIKSSGEFPFESSNIDCLIKPEKIALTSKILRHEGYHEMLIAREPHKFLFRKISNPKELPLHIHTKVEWEAIEFADPEGLRKRSRPFYLPESGLIIPSVEDSVLITIAHYFFEDHEAKIFDLLKLQKLKNEKSLDWKFMLGQAKKFCWSDAFLLNVYLIDYMSKELFGEEVFENPLVEGLGGSQSFFSKFINLESNGVLRIPYSVSALYFLKKIMKNPELKFSSKFNQVSYVCKDLLHRNIIGYIEI